MGNRAVITTPKNYNNNGVGVYLHWNGGRDSVEAFLEYMKLKGHRPPDEDCYGWARLCQVIGNFFGGTTSVGIDTVDHLDTNNWDNGTYIIRGWDIVDRKDFDGTEQDQYLMSEMLKAIDEISSEGVYDMNIEWITPSSEEELVTTIHDLAAKYGRIR